MNQLALNPMLWCSFADPKPWIGEILETQKYHLRDNLVTVSVDLRAGPVPRASLRAGHVLVTKVSKQIDFEDWLAVCSAVWNWPEDVGNAYREVLSLQTSRNIFRHFIARVDGAAVGAISVMTLENVAGGYFLSVLPQAENCGIGTALLSNVMNQLATEGFTHLVAQVTPRGYIITRKVNFAKSGNIQCFSRR